MKFTSYTLATVVGLAFAASSTEAFAPVASSPKTTQRWASVAEEASTDFDLGEYVMSKQPVLNAMLKESVKSIDPPNTDLVSECMEYSLMAGGKRVRPVLCLAAAEMFASSKEEAEAVALPTAVALEMIHTMSLMHDDLPSMDNDDLRRGKPTSHVVYGEDLAILGGDALLSTSFQWIAEHTPQDKVDPVKILDVVTRVGKCVGAKGLVGGQVLDLLCEGKRGKRDVTVDDLKWIHTHKTAALLVVAVSCGAILAGATEEEVEACERFALNIGLAFQVADDILDVTASTEDLGKTAAKDLEADKTTYPKLLGLDGARAEAQRLTDEAKAELEPFGERAVPLLALADYIINRKN
mmetsp:Transcript_22441/g.52974  ORF Transcript_22441/g.52974 Transcript_22441/m.52974 type:complete len:353 (-) Transcript_22441:1049-2107(-)|eukprot:CAMPEP_0172359664 /NCGR_PEP_ID=MMETSP1060-20121228/3850_1 /TAXON_ID=37318 /ORGANISM="Pseudo-nitzschia pungens, Strain cf. cingulata" /LENGTH=352 /DNA_ID=CAMNT_0013081433 /DNA_START=68 /DNA_END=1126 /DNA_ORIENTATION=-